ncbi:MAG TPA: double-strand break repair protein AddB [Devosiaceae bacterium]|jgi:ATP-dependent helicase/nuclease subunit B|nr:double-strand break repair protein AddB [Devosiaceae bacterium]
MSLTPRLFTIAPHVRFLETLVERILDGTLLSDWPREGPFWLSDITIVLPTRRARLALAERFLARGQVLLPDIRTFGGEQQDEEPFLPSDDLDEQPLPVVSQVQRRLALAQMVDAWARTSGGAEVFASPPNSAELFWLADSLGELIDDLEIEDVPHQALRQMVVGELAENWQQTLQFLDIVLGQWPQVLAERGLADAARIRNSRLRRQARTARELYGERPVIAAGSTGSIPATADLLKAIAGLPRGALVLPGLDTGMGETQFNDLRSPEKLPHGHPQYGLAQLLDRIGATPDQVTELAAEPGPRVELLRQALALADDTAGWGSAAAAMAGDVAAATKEITMLAARSEDEEARAIALAARAALAAGRTVGIVSPDRTLARRIVAELGRDNIAVDDAAGVPLFHSPAGRLVRLIAAAAASGFAAVDLMALLHHSGTRLRLSRRELSRRAQLVDLALLRGQRPLPGLNGLRQALASNLEERTRRPVRQLRERHAAPLQELLDSIGTAVGPVCELVDAATVSAPQLVAALAAAFAAVTSGADGEDGAENLPGAAEFRRWAGELSGLADAGPRFPPRPLDAVLAALMAGTEVRSGVPGRNDIAIWGALEARLQSRDLMILAGLNEDVWPAPADPGPWMSRGMRIAAGLEPPERRQGQAAHDFEMAAGNAEVILAFAERRGSAPALPSRLLQRLEAFAGKEQAEQMRARGAAWCSMARQRDAAGLPRPAPRPMPRPPAAQRPRKLSVTEIETLFRSPYDLYAKHVLKLARLPPLGEELDARERGTMIHEVFGTFVEQGLDVAKHDALERLMRLAESAFAGLEDISDRRDIWLRRFRRTAEQFLVFERQRDRDIASRHAELKGRWELPVGDGFVLTGQADRIDVRSDGTLEIIDFKTGSVPQPKVMRAFEAPQLLLEAEMARSGAFEQVPPRDSALLAYIKIGLGPKAFVPIPFALAEGFDLPAAAEAMSMRMQRHVMAFLMSDTHPLHARLLPLPGQRYPGAYDHLARTDEWTAITGDEDE